MDILQPESEEACDGEFSGGLLENGLYVSGAETLDSLDWCLEQLEHLKTNRSVAGLAADKFKKMLNEELSSFSRSGSTGMTISRHITDTYYG